MEKLEFKTRTEKLVKLMVDTIANKEYVKLVSSIPPKLSWASFIDAEQTLENACLGFGKWLVEQLAMWEEHCGKKFVVDHFEKSCMEDIGEEELEEEFEIYKNCEMYYKPTSFGEQLDFWFEIEFSIENGEIKAVFDVNI